MAVSADTRIGSEIAGYRLEALLGRGGMSVVYRAEHLRLKRQAALKLLAPELAQDERFRERFLRESEIAVSLDHPNIVPVYDAGEAEGLLYIAMRYVDGSDLKALLRREGALEPTHALALVAQVAAALDSAHERGLVHRDVKPSNVLITGRDGSEHCYLADFGLTKSADRTGLTDSGQLVGTIDYVAPEQIQGGAVDGGADVYSLACLLYQCLTGEVPFRRDSDVAVIYAHLEEPPPKASERRPDLPPELDGVVAKGMAKSRDDRWNTCAELVETARAALGHEVVVPPPARAARSRDRRLPTAGLAAALVVAAAIAVFLLVRSNGATVARADSLVRIDPAKGRVTAGIEVPGRPGSVTTCAGNVFVASLDGTVSEIDPRTSKPYVIHVGGTPGDISHVGQLATVVIGPPKNTVTVIDAEYGDISDVVALPGAPSASAAVAAFGRDVWIANPNARELELVEPPYTGIARRISLPVGRRTERRAAYAGIAAGEGALWVAGNDADRTLWRIDPARYEVTPIRLPFAPRAVAAGYGGVWIVDRRGGAIVRVNPATNRLGPRIPVGHGLSAVAVGAGSIWVANELEGTVSRIDPRTNTVVKTIHVGARPIDLAVGLGAVWIVRRTD